MMNEEDYGENIEGDVNILLETVQKMLEEKGEINYEYIISFFATLTVNLIINAECCPKCFMSSLTELIEIAESNDMLTSHKTPEQTH